VAIDSLANFGHLHNTHFELKDMLKEAYDNYEKYGNRWTARELGRDELRYRQSSKRLPLAGVRA
jgi:hypothetical protein